MKQYSQEVYKRAAEKRIFNVLPRVIDDVPFDPAYKYVEIITERLPDNESGLKFFDVFCVRVKFIDEELDAAEAELAKTPLEFSDEELLAFEDLISDWEYNMSGMPNRHPRREFFDSLRNKLQAERERRKND